MLANTNYNNTHNPSFGAKNASIRKADKICRLVNNEFPAYSNTKLIQYKTINKTSSARHMLGYVTDMIRNLREYYLTNNETNSVIGLLKGVKKTKIANCYEKANITNTALRMNGYKDVYSICLCAKDTKNGKIRDLDHVISAIGLNLPKDFQYWEGTGKLSDKYFVRPNKDTIFIDSWAGVTDSASAMTARYKSNAQLPQKLKKDEKLVYLPTKFVDFEHNDIEYFKLKYPNLMIHKEDTNKLDHSILNYSKYDTPEFPDETIQISKNERHLGQKKQEHSTNSFWAAVMSMFCDPTSWF